MPASQVEYPPMQSRAQDASTGATATPPSRGLAVDVLSGAGLGALLGLVVGLSTSPVVAVVVGALTSLLAAFLGLDSGTEPRVAALDRLRLNGVRIGSFGFAATAGVLVGLYVRVNNPLAESPVEQLARWEAALPDNPALARQMMVFERTGITPSALSLEQDAPVAVTVAEGAAAHRSVLFGSLQGKDLCRDLAAERFGDDLTRTLAAYDDRGAPLSTVAARIKDLPAEQQGSALAAVHALLCELEREKLLK
jgi:hypothetical protein